VDRGDSTVRWRTHSVGRTGGEGQQEGEAITVACNENCWGKDDGELLKEGS